MRYRVTHHTTYSYQEMVSICHNEAHLEPRRTALQQVWHTGLDIEPATDLQPSQLDYFGNPTQFFTLQTPHHEMRVTARSELDVIVPALPEPAETPSWERVRERVARERSRTTLDAFEMCFASPQVELAPEFTDYAAATFSRGRKILDGARELTERIHRDFAYRPGETSVATPVREIFEARSGVCQDFSHFMIATLRGLGLPARYVSGYLRTQRSGSEPALIGADASHAWVSLWCGEAGWIDLDPTNDLVPCNQHVTLAWGRDYSDVAPLKGVLVGGGGHAVDVAVSVEPFGESEARAPSGARPEPRREPS